MPYYSWRREFDDLNGDQFRRLKELKEEKIGRTFIASAVRASTRTFGFALEGKAVPSARSPQPASR
jgi:hypothetical protein